MSIDKKYLSDLDSCFVQSGKKFLAGRKLMHVKMCKYTRRRTGHKRGGGVEQYWE